MGDDERTGIADDEASSGAPAQPRRDQPRVVRERRNPSEGGEQASGAAARPRARSILRWALWGGGILLPLLLCAAGWLYWKYHVGPPPFGNPSPIPKPASTKKGMVVQMPNGNLVGLLGTYDDELTAYLRLQYFRSLKQIADDPILMTTTEEGSGPRYRVYVVLKNDLLSQSKLLAELQVGRYIDSFATESPPRSEIEDWMKQTRLFDAAYQGPVKKRLLQLPRKELTSAVARFILFKTRTDRRVRERIEPAVTRAPSAADAREFAADMIDVAEFYDIPLDMLLGIGAMENNYLDVRGDLHHAVWKKHARKGDIVLRRSKGRVLVSNYSLGPWQITRETLRYVHGLYLRDTRDYTKLPERLRPSRTLDLDHIDTHVLTTYAGLLLRKLLDDYDGDVVKAQGAYNGGPGDPNLSYSQGVSMVSAYAHRILSMAAGRKGDSVAQRPVTIARR
jgi:hypothetical protein